MTLNIKRIFFVTSSIPETKSDWKSVFIGDMLKAFSENVQTIIYWGPNGIIPDKVISSVGIRYQPWIKNMVNRGGVAKILRHGTLVEKMFYPAIMLISIQRSAKSFRGEFDSYFVNWLQNSISIPSDGKPLVVTVLGSDMALLNNGVIRYLLKKVFKNHKTTLLPNAEWMVDRLEFIFGKVADIEYLSLGIREDWFSGDDRVPSLWLSVSRVTEKKVSKLFDWGGEIFGDKDKLTLIGPNQEGLFIPEWIDFKGSTTLDELKNYWYPKAKALIFLSDHDEGRPQTIIEAMASGVPVICLDKPLYREFIDSGFNGYLVGSESELIVVKNKLENVAHNLEISTNARQTMMDKIGTWPSYINNVNALFDT